MNNHAIDAIIFDLDGVLIDSADAHLQSWRRLAGELGKSISDAQFRDTFGRQNRDIIPLLFGEIDSVEMVYQLGERKEAYYREIITDRVPTIDGATTLVRDCHRAGLRCAIGSSGHPRNIALAVSALDIESEISTIVSGHDVTVGKPDPQVFLLAAKGLDVSPNACAVIEDAPAGIQAALNAGMTSIAVTTEHPRADLRHAHLVVDALTELSPERIRTCRR